MTIRPAPEALRPIRLVDPGRVERIEGIALSSHLRDADVSDRMADACEARLGEAGLEATIERRYDTTAHQAGAGLTAWATTSTGCVLGSDMAGARGRRSEWIGRRVAEALIEDLSTGATVDRHVADMLVPWATVAAGESIWIVPRQTDHLETSLGLAGELGARVAVAENRVEVTGLGLAP